MLSSSVVLAVITGCFILWGGAKYEGYAHALGLAYLAGLQPTEYIFAGGELLLVTSFILGFAVAGLTALLVPLVAARKLYFLPRRLESTIFLGLTAIPTVVLAILTFRTLGTGSVSITMSACPISMDHDSQAPLYIFCGVILYTSIVPLFFFTRLLRLMFLAWGMITALLVCTPLGGLLAR